MGPYWGTVYKPDLRLEFINRQLGTSTTIPGLDCFIWAVVRGCLCIQLIRGFALYTIIPSSLKKRDKSVGNVGNVGKSEKSPENFPRKVFQNAYITYTTYIGWELEMDYRLGMCWCGINARSYIVVPRGRIDNPANCPLSAAVRRNRTD